MKNIVLEITEQDIKNYLESHRQDQKFECKRELFIKYLKESNALTKESYEILARKANSTSQVESPIPLLPSFEDYCSSIRNLDMSGICHILIPSLGCQEKIKQGKLFEWKPLEISTRKLDITVKECKCSRTNIKDFTRILEDTLENYQIAGDISIKDQSNSSFFVSFPKDAEVYRGILAACGKVYGEHAVQKVRQIAMRKN